MIVAAALGVVALLIVAYEFMPSSSTIASTTPATTATDPQRVAGERCPSRGAPRFRVRVGKKRASCAEPRPHLAPAATRRGRADQVRRLGKKHFRIAGGSGDSHTAGPRRDGQGPDDRTVRSYSYRSVAPPPPIPLKFFGFANRPGEPRKIFLIQGRRCFHCGRGRDCRPPLQGRANFSHLGRYPGRGGQRSAAEHTADAGEPVVKKCAAQTRESEHRAANCGLLSSPESPGRGIRPAHAASRGRSDGHLRPAELLSQLSLRSSGTRNRK